MASVTRNGLGVAEKWTSVAPLPTIMKATKKKAMGGLLSRCGASSGDRELRAYTRPLFSSTSAVSDTKYTLKTP